MTKNNLHLDKENNQSKMKNGQVSLSTAAGWDTFPFEGTAFAPAL